MLRSTIETVVERGTLRCALRQEWPTGYPQGFTAGAIRFDVEVCKAIAAAALGDRAWIEFVNPQSNESRFDLLASGAVDVLITATTAAADASAGVDFASPFFYTGVAFAVRADSGINSIADIRDRASICVPWGYRVEQVLADYYTDLGLHYIPLGGEHVAIADAFFAGRCEVLAAYESDLASWIEAREDRNDYRLLPEIISRDPIAPAVREHDSRWLDIVNWIVLGLIRAEELGITQANVNIMASNPPSFAVPRLLGALHEWGTVDDLGFDIAPQFVQQAIAAVGNYGEIYGRTIGDSIPRACTLNALTIDDSVDCPPGRGGILYAPPYR